MNYKQLRMFVYGSWATAVVSLGGAIVLEMPAYGRSLLCALASTSAACVGLSGEEFERESSLEGMRHKAKVLVGQDAIAHQTVKQKAHQEITGNVQVISLIYELPVGMRDYYLRRFNLAGVLPPAPVPVEEAPQIEAPTVTVSAEQVQAGAIAEIEDPPDLDWLDEKFIRASKGVFGARGSGKTTWFNFEAAAFLAVAPEGVLWICDHHYCEDEDGWLPGIPRDVFRQHYLADTVDEIFGKFENLYKVLMYRIDNRNRSGAPYKLICDEFMGFLSRLDKERANKVIRVVTATQDEGRKYGIDVSLGLHALKKGRHGIDSSVLFQMDLLCLGRSIADTSTPFPADFDVKALLSGLSLLSGRVAVLRKLEEEPYCVQLPVITDEMITLNYSEPPDAWGDHFEEQYGVDPDDITDDVPEVDVWGEFEQWFLAVAEPTNQEIKAKWLELTGKPLNDRGVQMLRDRYQR